MRAFSLVGHDAFVGADSVRDVHQAGSELPETYRGESPRFQVPVGPD